jgi:hypothetical protein
MLTEAEHLTIVVRFLIPCSSGVAQSRQLPACVPFGQ